MNFVEIVFWASCAILVYTYCVYPLFAIVIGAGRVGEPVEQLPAISVLVPAHNEASVIESKIENFKQLDYPSDRLELIIGDDGSTDRTAEIVQEHLSNDLRFLSSNLRSGKAATMNRMVEESRHPLLLFTDANVQLSNSALRRMVDHLGNPSVGAVTGEVRLIGSDQEFSPGETLYYVMERRIQGAESRLGSVMGVDGGMYLVKRELYSRLANDTILDDFTVSVGVMRAGFRVIYESAAKAVESGTPSSKQEFDRRIRIAAGAVQLIKRGWLPKLTQPVLWFQFISHKLFRWFSPVFLAVLLISNIFLVQSGPRYQFALACQMVLYVLTVIAFVWPRLRRVSLFGVLFYFGISQLAMTFGLIRGVLNRQPPQWEKGVRIEDCSAAPVNPCSK